MRKPKALPPGDMPTEPDQIDGIPRPREQTALWGHQAAEKAFFEAHTSGCLHHAWLITGPRGIGKATFAFRAAKFLMNPPDEDLIETPAKADLSTDPAAPTVSKISHGSHGQLLHLTRAWNRDRKRFGQDLTVDTIRKTTSFFGSTAAEGGWRIAIIDAADDMNASASNALLKILEEPPKQSLFFVICHRPGRLLPTIRSRCRHLPLRPLTQSDLLSAVQTLPALVETADKDAITAMLPYAEGSVRRLIQLLISDSAAHMTHIETFLRSAGDNPAIAHALSDQMSREAGDETFTLFQTQVLTHLHQRAKVLANAKTLSAANEVSEAHQFLANAFQRQEAFNLDRKQLVLCVARTLAALPTSA